MIIPANGNNNSIEIVPQAVIGKSAEHKNGWISVKDSLPTRNKVVLFQGTHGGMYIGQYQGDIQDGSVSFCVWDGDKNGYMPITCVAWQPLPAPYEGE